jgi:hypothetical protein
MIGRLAFFFLDGSGKKNKMLSAEQFKRRFGVYKQTYRKMVESVKSVEAESNSVSKRRPKPKLSIEEQVLATLEYWREYRTYFHISTSGQISKSTIGRIVNRTEKMLLQSGNFRLKGKKTLLNQAEIPVITVMDVTETPTERPKKKQRDFLQVEETEKWKINRVRKVV